MTQNYEIATYKGNRVSAVDPKLDQISIVDIAHGLAMKCRFSGHLTSFYSVAQHSVWVCRKVREMGGSLAEQQYALLHDAHEAYTADMPAPFKPLLPDLSRIDWSLQVAVNKKFGIFESDKTSLVEYCDNLAGWVEARDFHPHDETKWAGWSEEIGRTVYNERKLHYKTPVVSREFFLQEFDILWPLEE